jgi:hypothetical protein
MLRLVALAAAMVVSATTASAASSLDVDGGVARTARAVRAAVKKHAIEGHVWLGKLRGVGGKRDTLFYVPSTIDATKTIDVVVYMEGVGSFADEAMDTRHVASMARLHGNSVYVAPDAPSSSLGVRASGNEHWQAGCAEHACAGGRAAPGDFLVFFDEVRTKLANTVGVARDKLDLRVSLIGFSRGGKGALRALEQLADAKFVVGGLPVKVADVIFADGNYLDDALTRSWEILEPLREAPRLTILVASGPTETGNRTRAFAFWQTVAPDAPAPTADQPSSTGRLRVIPLAGGHFAIGDMAVDFLGGGERVVEAS